MPFKRLRGLSLIEALVGSALVLIVFLAIFATYQLAIELVFTTKAASGGSALVNERIEYIRGLDYDAVGTSGGIPSGSILQTEQLSLNGITYTMLTTIQYVDDPSDGLEGADETGVTADYKQVRVAAQWAVRGMLRSTFAMTTIAPNGIETLAAGGTLKVNVFDINAAPVSGASVRIVNAGVTPAVDVTVSTGASGTVWFPGTPPGAGYQVTVTKTGFSSAQTYSATTENPNPSPGHVAVVDDSTTTLSLEVNQTGILDISTWSPPGPASSSDTFTNQSALSATTSTTVSGGALVLEGGAGAYATAGEAISIPVEPGSLSAWDSFSWVSSTSPEASLITRLYYWNGTEYTIVPDDALPGNSTGLSNSPVNLSTLAVATYPRLQMRAYLTSTDPLWTPEVLSWQVSYMTGLTPLPNISFGIYGARTIGVTAGGAPIYKTNAVYTTDQYGEKRLDPTEADGYTLSLSQGSSYVVSEQCPYASSVAPGQSAEVALTLVPATSHALRVVVLGNGAPLVGASVTVQGGAVNQSIQTGTCGQSFFPGITSGTYTVTVSAPGFQTAIDPNVAVSGYTIYTGVITP